MELAYHHYLNLGCDVFTCSFHKAKTNKFPKTFEYIKLLGNSSEIFEYGLNWVLSRTKLLRYCI